MRRAFVLPIAVLIAMLAPPISAAGSHASHRAAIITFERPTRVAQQRLVGTYVIVHDDARMARGEPCTALYRVRRGSEPLEEVVAFYCIPSARPISQSFTTTVERGGKPDGADTLIEYQFAGDPEAHGVPVAASVSYNGSLRERCVGGRAASSNLF